MADTDKTDLAQLTVQLLSSYLSNNTVAREDLADLIKTTRAALLDEISPPTPPKEEYVPAVSVRRSIASRDHILSLIDGKPYKMLKRHLAQHGLTPVEYRERYGLPYDYPMTATSYSEARRATAARIGLGSRKAADILPPESLPAPAADTAAAAPAEAPPVPASTQPKASGEKIAPASGSVAGNKRGGRKLKAESPLAQAQKSSATDTAASNTPPDSKSASTAKAVKSSPAKSLRKPGPKQSDAPAPPASADDNGASQVEAFLETPPLPVAEPASATRKKPGPKAKAPSPEAKRGGREPKVEATSRARTEVGPAAIKSVAASLSPSKVKKSEPAKGQPKPAAKADASAADAAPSGESQPEKRTRKTLKIRTDV